MEHTNSKGKFMIAAEQCSQEGLWATMKAVGGLAIVHFKYHGGIRAYEVWYV